MLHSQLWNVSSTLLFQVNIFSRSIHLVSTYVQYNGTLQTSKQLATKNLLV